MGNVPGNDASSYQRAELDDYPGNVRDRGSRAGAGAGGSYNNNHNNNNERSQSAASASFNSSMSDSDAGRLERAAALEAKLTKKRPKPKDLAAVKDAHWKRYNELDRNVDPAAAAAVAAAPAQPAVGYRLSDSAAVTRPTPTIAAMPGSSPTAVSPGSSTSPGLIPGINRSRAAPTASQILSGQKRYETPEEAAIRAQRAAVFAAPSRQKQEKDRNAREDKWKTYAELEAQAASKPSVATIVNAPLPFGFPADGADYSSQPSAPSPDDGEERKSGAGARAPAGASASSFAAASSSSSSGVAASASARPALQVQSGGGMSLSDLPPHFQQQMAFLASKVRAMPPQSVSLLRKILQNLLKAGDTPDESGAKFRRIKLANPKIQEAVVHTDGAMELLVAVGFGIDGETEEAYLVFPDGTPLDIAQLAYQELAVFSPTGAA